ncbi:MAG: hypothetical protein FGM15_10885 [Chthoniobacterales bacterium]|nr:hypothetical protein [Chthoniobacterales bacterium]
MTKTKYTLVALLALCGMARAELLLTFKQTGADVTATLSGTLGGAWGSPAVVTPNPSEVYISAYGGWSSYSAVTLAYGASTNYVNNDSYQLFSGVSSTSPFTSLSGSFLSGGVLQPGSPLDYVYFDVAADWLWLSLESGVTDLGTNTIVWSNKSLSDFFATGAPFQTDIVNASSQKYMTLEIGEFAPAAVPEPGTWAAAALLAGGATFAGWRKRRSETQKEAA